MKYSSSRLNASSAFGDVVAVLLMALVVASTFDIASASPKEGLSYPVARPKTGGYSSSSSHKYPPPAEKVTTLLTGCNEHECDAIEKQCYRKKGFKFVFDTKDPCGAEVCACVPDNSIAIIPKPSHPILLPVCIGDAQLSFVSVFSIFEHLDDGKKKLKKSGYSKSRSSGAPVIGFGQCSNFALKLDRWDEAMAASDHVQTAFAGMQAAFEEATLALES